MNNEFLKMQKLAGLITESEYKTKLNEGNTPQDIEDFLNDMINMSIPEGAEEGERIEDEWEASEYADEDAYGEAANEFINAYQYIKSQGGRITIEGNPDVTYSALDNGNIHYKFIVTLD
jgi:hypothetical protein